MSNIHRGEDVYFECDIKANPAVYNVTWRHNVNIVIIVKLYFIIPPSSQGKRVDENVTNGIILGNQTLVLQAVDTDQAGLYTCVASNVVADGESNALLLDIKCKTGPGHECIFSSNYLPI